MNPKSPRGRPITSRQSADLDDNIPHHESVQVLNLMSDALAACHVDCAKPSSRLSIKLGTEVSNDDTIEDDDDSKLACLSAAISDDELAHQCPSGFFWSNWPKVDPKYRHFFEGDTWVISPPFGSNWGLIRTLDFLTRPDRTIDSAEHLEEGVISVQQGIDVYAAQIASDFRWKNANDFVKHQAADKRVALANTSADVHRF
ncbi:hypothetical protein M0804_014454 [Polistes exclamans]|nr:hypothetical protein M0804_014454 [Polistes exclamans]